MHLETPCTAPQRPLVATIPRSCMAHDIPDFKSSLGLALAETDTEPSPETNQMPSFPLSPPSSQQPFQPSLSFSLSSALSSFTCLAYLLSKTENPDYSHFEKRRTQYAAAGSRLLHTAKAMIRSNPMAKFFLTREIRMVINIKAMNCQKWFQYGAPYSDMLDSRCSGNASQRKSSSSGLPSYGGGVGGRTRRGAGSEETCQEGGGFGDAAAVGHGHCGPNPPHPIWGSIHLLCPRSCPRGRAPRS